MALAKHTAESSGMINRGDARYIFDQEARRCLCMSAEEFEEKFDSVYWPEPDFAPFVMYVQSVREFAS